MRPRWTLTVLGLALLLAGGCGGGTTSTAPTGGDGLALTPAQNLVVVRYDRNADGNPDLLTLDTDQRPLEIVEALEGRPEGGAVDATASLAGRTIAPEIDEALANHLAESFDLDVETELEVTVGDRVVNVTVIE